MRLCMGLFSPRHENRNVLINYSKMCRCVLSLFYHVNFKIQTLEVHPVLGFKVLIFYIILICVSLFTYNVSLNF